jgi:hypothetical protein
MAGGERSPPRGVFSSAGPRPAGSVCLVAVRAAEATRLLHLAKEEELVDLLERPVCLADRDAGHECRQVGCLFRSHPLQQEVSIRRAGCQRSLCLRLELRGRSDDVRPRHAHGGRREDRPRGVVARRSSLTPSTSSSLACHGSPCRPVQPLVVSVRVAVACCDCRSDGSRIPVATVTTWCGTWMFGRLRAMHDDPSVPCPAVLQAVCSPVRLTSDG